MITIATVWLWAQAAIHLPEFFESAPALLVTALSYGFYILGGAFASYLVIHKTGNREATTGLKVGAICFITSAFYYTLYSGVQQNLITAMIISFPMGGYLGALARIMQNDRGIEAPSAGANTDPDKDASSS